jgi:hypothetical protein
MVCVAEMSVQSMAGKQCDKNKPSEMVEALMEAAGRCLGDPWGKPLQQGCPGHRQR